MAGDIFNSVLIVIAFVALVWLVWFMARPDTQRHDEEAAREFYERHGRWPDESA